MAQDAKEAKAKEPTPEAPKAAAPFIPGVKQLTNKLNGKQDGKWKIRNHEGKIVHATDDADEAVHLMKMHALNGPGPEEDDFPGKFWAILPHDPRKEVDPEWVAEKNRRKARAIGR
jgi:hypothetical protein